MNKIVMVVWGLVISAMLFLVLIIGYKEQDKDYINISKKLKLASESYIKDNNLEAEVGYSLIVFVEDLIKGNYIKEDEKLEKYCIDGVVYSNELLIDRYIIRKNCEDKETEE